MGIPVQLIELLEDWLSNRSAYCEVNRVNSKIFEVNHGTIQGSILGPLLLHCLFHLLQTLHSQQLMLMTTTFLALAKQKKKHWKIV